jgi:hypothetical protein
MVVTMVRNYLISLMFFLSFLFFTFEGYAQTTPQTYKGDYNSIEGMQNITTSITSDTFNPLTHYNEGDWNIVFSPVYFTVSTLQDNWDGDGLSGWAFSIACNYAINTDWFFYVTFARLKTKGDLVSSNTNRMEGSDSCNVYQLGFGYDRL